ncbi:MAG: NfeD family protein [Spirochaetaceae bacterium]|jgi:membrane protein implicated in regulation of membrane protease activity|nr:NfeD family protein [Spirochaetaceae bacterium]GMO26334.1 MAG: NfeD family protein [Termitinemataceae bacterium]
MEFYSLISSSGFWLLLAVIFSVVELASSFSLTTIWFALSAMITALAAGVTGSFSIAARIKIELLIFIAVAVVLLIFTRPIAVKKFKVGKIKTNIDDLIGREAVVITNIAPHSSGEIKVRGQIWTAVTEDAAELKKDSICFILRIEGVKAIVSSNVIQ